MTFNHHDIGSNPINPKIRRFRNKTKFFNNTEYRLLNK